MLFLFSCNESSKFNTHIEVVIGIYDFCLHPPPTQFQGLQMLFTQFALYFDSLLSFVLIPQITHSKFSMFV